jgi:hypothetical protein
MIIPQDPGAFSSVPWQEPPPLQLQGQGAQKTTSQAQADWDKGLQPDIEATRHTATGQAEAQWYVELNGTQQGPFGLQTVVGMLQSGQLTPDSLAWREGMPGWQALKNIPEFASAIPQTFPSDALNVFRFGAAAGTASPYAPRRSGMLAAQSKGFFATLFDFSFSHFVMLQVIPVVYALGVLFAVGCGGWLCISIIGAGVASQYVTLGIAAMIGGPIVGLPVAFLLLMSSRLGCELIVVLFRIAENTRKTSEYIRVVAQRDAQDTQVGNGHVVELGDDRRRT